MNLWAKPKVLLYVVGIFLAGGISGAIIGYSFRHTGMRGGPPSREQMISFVRTKLFKEVGLTDAQWTELGPIITNTTDEIWQFDSTNRDRIRQLIEQSDSAILSRLTPEQQPRMQKMIEDRQKHWRGAKK